MGHTYEPGAYERAIHAACLGQDLEVGGVGGLGAAVECALGKWPAVC
jgi:hypothetical protein